MPTTTKLQESNNNQLSSSSSSSFSTSRHQEKRPSLASGHSSLSSGDEASKLLSSNADYDRIRNSTLMFFLDRLYMASKEGQEARTLHDLSCLFGTREFSKEMRQIVGASRNGLKKFLQSYPSLFTIDGDNVYLSQLKPDSTNRYQRDYNKEAVEYFTNKLLQFGTSLVPIRNLFGYRSQASQEVRHVSGKNTKEFKQFLSAHDEVFRILAKEHVVLVSALKELEESGKLDEELLQLESNSLQLSSYDLEDQLSSLQENHSINQSEQTLQSLPIDLNKSISNDITVTDPYLNKQFAHTIEQCMQKMNLSQDGISVESLHDKILQECQNKLFLKMVKTINDFKLFLRMHPKIFKRLNEGSHVNLLSEEERRELEMQSFPSSNLAGALNNRQHSNLRRCDTIESDTLNQSNQLTSLPPVKLTNKKQDDQMSVASSTVSSLNNSINGSYSLRATAPPFVPSSRVQKQTSTKTNSIKQVEQSTIKHKPLQRAISASGNQNTPQSHNNNNNNNNNHNINHNHLQRSYTTTARHHSPAMSPPTPVRSSNYHQLLSRQQSNSTGDDLRARTVNIVREASNIISRIMTTAEAVAFDCKGYNLGFNGQITLIQFGWLPKQHQSTISPHPHRLLSQSTDCNNSEQNLEKQKPEVCIFDLITNPELAYCLKPLLESESIVKIVHDVRNKSNALHVQFDIMLKHVFDTQVANLVIQQQETGKPAYKSRYISMGKLCEIYGNESLIKYRNLIQAKTRRSGHSIGSNGKVKDVNYWRTRPLTDAMVYESTMDVYSLVGGVYQNLKDKIKPEYQLLFEQLNLEGVLARIKPDEIRSVKNERKIDLEVIDLKRKLYSDTKNSIVLSNREIRLLRHIELTEEVRQKIQQCKKVAKKLERLDMKAAQLQSLNSQFSANLNNPNPSSSSSSISSDNNQHPDDPQSSIHSSSRKSSSSTSSFVDQQQQQQQQPEESLNLAAKEEFGNLMNSSIFDELKDKMIDSSSSLLESIKDDDEDLMKLETSTGANNSVKKKLEHSASQCSSCGCNCQKDSSSLIEPTSIEKNLKEEMRSIEVSNSLQEDSSLPKDGNLNLKCELETCLKETDHQVEKNSDLSNESKTVDIAVQCDLLG